MRELVGLVVLPHFLQHLLDAVLIWDLPVEVDAHEVGHPVQQAGHAAQLLPRVLRTVRPGVVNEEHAAGEVGWCHTLGFSYTHIQSHRLGIKAAFLWRWCDS